MFTLVRLSIRWRAFAAIGALFLALLGGCATNGDPRDPLEPVNRAVYKFNDGVDALLIKPGAEFYRAMIPSFARTGVSNFFSNINDILVALNDLLQGKVPEAINDFGRVLVNTTLGVFGLMDPATDLGVEKRYEDFGQTLGHWGFGDGPYIVLPILGPSSVRDTVGWAGDIYLWPITYVDPNSDRNLLIGMRIIDLRSQLLEASQILETAALDPYQFVRDAYLQRRRSQVYDGSPPDDTREEPASKPSSRAPLDIEPAQALVPASGADTAGVAPTTPAADEARKPETQVPPAASAQPAAVVEAPKPPRMVRIWLPSRSN